MTAKWFWTAVTRGVSLKNLYFYIGEEQTAEKVEARSLTMATAKLRSYIEDDKSKGRFEGDATYDVKEMAKMARDAHGRRCQGLCGETCDSAMDVFSDEGESISFDRINNDRGHSIDNLRCICLACNVRGQDRDDKM